jgi:hypothetical protein
MATKILIDNFTGNTSEFYALFTEEINARQLPELEFRWVEEAESEKRLFNKGQKLPALQVAFKSEWIVVFAYQLGNCFFVSVRTTNTFHNPETSTHLYDAMMFCFEHVVERSTRQALRRHMESRSVSVPSFLYANDNEARREQPAS